MTKDPIGTDKKKSENRVFRGVSWNNFAHLLVVSYRFSYPPSNSRCILGLRPVRSVKEK